MSMITTYRIRAASRDELWELLASASLGKARAFAWQDATGRKIFDEARVRQPWAESVAGEPAQVLDAETGETETIVPRIETGLYLCEVALVDQQDFDLAGLVVG